MPAQPRSPVITAAFWMLGAIVAFTSMTVAGRAVSDQLDTFEIMLYRSLTGIIVVLIVGGWAGTLRQVSTAKWRLHGVRNVAHFTGQNLWFYAITVLPLAQVFALELTSPIWVVILSPLFLGEKLTRVKAFCAIAGFIGVLIVTRPGMAPLSAGVFAAAGAAFAFALTAIFTRQLTRSESITTIMVYLTCFQAVFGLVCAGIDGDITLPSADKLPFVIIIGLAGLTAHFCLTTALSIAPASVVMPIDFARLPVIAVIGMLLYSEALDIFVFIGGALIFAANYLNILSASRAKPD
ncbi:DMT family transporter [Yoonia sp. 208BN28-4]|uniref:DMT family transporter n=1 Tax=Yoonia sp. 208BN28-4 TaxID=3126505 RepID=UPI00309510B6